MSKTAQQVRSELTAKGMTLPEWAKRHGFPVRSVRAVLYGHNKGRYGQSHQIAVALGLKDQPK
jgi:gp16 family phage-associated protein